ncbi:hypothetical protein [Spirillospora sp. NPDC047279]|uniref:hypothetical protein n=1 Tax=Spirillospora sp. NPDC047279 TaxID=3155478 RepID=UPI00340040C7
MVQYRAGSAGGQDARDRIVPVADAAPYLGQFVVVADARPVGIGGEKSVHVTVGQG